MLTPRYAARLPLAALTIWVMLAALAAVAAGPSNAASAERFAPDASSFMLDNGLQVIVIPDRRTPVVTHMVWYKVGSADEPEGKTGVAHYLEHLLFKGTTNHPQGAFSKLVAQRGGQENAFTSSDYTGYFQRVAKEHLELVMELEADRMANLQVAEADALSERDVVMEERRSRTDNEPSAQLREELMAALYRAHPYGRPVIGWEHDIQALNLPDAVDFYDTHYTPNNAILVVAGDVDAGEVKTLAERHYGAVARRAEPGPRARIAEPPQRAARRVTLVSPRVTQPSMRRYYDVPSANTGAPGESEALSVLSEILGGGATSRIYRQLVVERGMATSAGAFYSGTAVDSTQFGLYGAPRDTVTLDEVEAAIDEIIADIKANGVTEEEVELAKTSLIARAVYAQDSQVTLARVFGAGLSSGLTMDEIQSWPEAIARVTAEAVQEAAVRHLVMEASVTGNLLRPDTAGEAAGTDEPGGTGGSDDHDG